MKAFWRITFVLVIPLAFAMAGFLIAYAVIGITVPEYGGSLFYDHVRWAMGGVSGLLAGIIFAFVVLLRGSMGQMQTILLVSFIVDLLMLGFIYARI